MKLVGMLVVLFLVFGLQSSQAQISTDILVQAIDQRVQCEEVFVSGANSWVPFTLKLWYPQTAKMPEIRNTSGGAASATETPVTYSEKSLTLFTNSTYQYQFDLILTYNTPTPGTLVSEYWSNGILVSKNAENLDGLEICKRYIITTTAPPKFPTLQEILTDAGVEAVEQFQFIVPEQKNVKNTVAINTVAIVIFIIVVLVLLWYLIKTIQRIHRERIATVAQVNTIIGKADKSAEDAAKMIKKGNEVLDRIENFIPEIRAKTDSFMDIFRMEVNTILLEISKKLELENQTFERIKKERLELYKEKAEFQRQMQKSTEKVTTITDEKQPTLIESIMEKPMEIAKKITSLGKSENTETEIHKADDFDIKDDPSDEEMEHFYSLNDYEVNQKLYQKYYNLFESDPNNAKVEKRRNIINMVLHKQWKSKSGKPQ